MSRLTQPNLIALICILLFSLPNLVNCGGSESDSTPTHAEEPSIQYRATWQSLGYLAPNKYFLLVEFNGKEMPNETQVRALITDPITGEVFYDATEDLSDSMTELVELERSGTAVKMGFNKEYRDSLFYHWHGSELLDINWLTVEFQTPN